MAVPPKRPDPFVERWGNPSITEAQKRSKLADLGGEFLAARSRRDGMDGRVRTGMIAMELRSLCDLWGMETMVSREAYDYLEERGMNPPGTKPPTTDGR